MADRENSTRRVVYSTDGSHAKTCPKCGAKSCRCQSPEAPAAREQSPRVRREIKGRGGKTVTVVYDLKLSEAELREVARQLKQSCATGGTVKGGRIELQGDHRDLVVARLLALGYPARAAGG
jgi:translation initiation factor 1